MAILRIVKHPNDFLLKQSKEVTEFDASLHQLLDDMRETMVKAGGLGIAAVQVGRLLRACIIAVRNENIELVNPVVLSGTKEKNMEEGCLSVPKDSAKIKRFHQIVVRAQDRFGKVLEREFAGLAAVCVQHEIDHMNGVLIVQ